jgi:hypothetical protein
MALRGAPSPIVAIPSGDLFPSGIRDRIPDVGVQSTVRPPGWLFRSSVGFPTVRPGKNGFQDASGGLGIGFTPMHYAEDITQEGEHHGIPALVDQSRIPGDVTEIPGSEYLGVDGMMSATDVAQNKGPYHGRDNSLPSDDGRSAYGHDPHNTLPDMGDRNPNRPLTRAYWMGFAKNPTTMFRAEWQDHPITAIATAAVGIGLAYVIGSDFERIWARRRSNSPVKPLTTDVVEKPVKTVATAPIAAVETAAEEVEKVTTAAAETVKDASEAVKDAAETVSE